MSIDNYLAKRYKIILTPLKEEVGGGWLAEIPDLPGCMSDGESIMEAITNVHLAKKSWLETALILKRDIKEGI